MARRRIIKSVLHNFIGTYTSRYTDYDGYWLFGFLVGEIRQILIDLIYPTTEQNPSAPMAAATCLAAQKFKEQSDKAGLPLSYIQSAKLEITKHSAPRKGEVNGKACQGYDVTFRAKVISDHGKAYEEDLTLFVAPHDPAKEHRSITEL